LLLAGAVAIAGCKSPNKANIQLRKDKQQLESQIEDLRTKLDAALAQIEAYEKQAGTVQTLPRERLDLLYTVHRIDLKNLTGGADLDLQSPGDEALKVYLIPLDESGAPIKATGHVTVELFDLARPHDNRIGRWELEPAQMKETWRSLLSLNAFVLTLPWQTAPERPDLAVKVTFRDLLTGRTFDKLTDIRVKPPSSPPATQPQQISGP
jgi:outer membrane murein-binding lipoprotein Lpp